MALIGNNHDLREYSHRFLISESFSEKEFSLFRDYCASSNILYVDNLRSYDYVAFHKHSKTDAEFVKKIRARVEAILSTKALTTPSLSNPNSVAQAGFSEPVDRLHSKSWESSLKAAADAYMDSPIDGLAMPNRIRHRLEKGGITTIGKFLITTPVQFVLLGGIGDHSLSVINSISKELVRNYINHTPIAQSLSPVSSLKKRDQKKHVLSEQAAANPGNQDSDYSQLTDDYDEALLHIAANDCMDLPLDVLHLSQRTTYRLLCGGIETVGRILLATDEQLLSVKHLGPAALREIREASRRFLQDYIIQNPNWQRKIDGLSPDVYQLTNHASMNGNLNLSARCRLCVEDILAGNSQSGDKFKLLNEESKIIKGIQQAIEVVGIELWKHAYYNPANTRAVIQSFQTFINVQKVIQTIRDLISNIPEARRSKKLSPYIRLFNGINNVENDKLFNYFATCTTVNDISENIYFIAEQENQHFVNVFIEWLSSFDILDFVKSVLAEITGKDRYKQILSRRATGETLDAISSAYNLTRERIRQIESHVIRVYSKYQVSHPLLLAISVELNGESIITSNDIRSIIPDSEPLLYLLKKHPDSQFIYDKHLDFFYLSELVDPDSVYDFISGLPEFINESERPALLSQISQSNNIPVKYLELVFEKHYQCTGTTWHAGKMNPATMYSYVIEKYFPNGIRLYDDDDMSRFKNYVHEVFGDIGWSENNHALEGIIQRICLLYDRGVYIHPSRVSIPDDLVYRIEEYFIQSGRTSMAFPEIYDKFANELLLQANITNRYALQGILKARLEGKYVFYKDGISTKEGYSITQEIGRYICNNSPVTKETLMAAFSGISEAMLAQNIARLPYVILIDNSTYLYSKTLKLTADDYKIKKIIQNQTSDHPVTASKLLEHLYSIYPDFLIRNNINSPNTLFGILQFIFSDYFSFSRPYISSLDSNGISKREIIISLLAEQECVKIPYLIALCEEHHLTFQSPSLMVRALQDNYLQVDEDTLVSIMNIGVTDEKLDKVKELLGDTVYQKGYLAFKSIDNFIFYPDLGIPWTTFLLCGIIDKYFPADFTIINNPTIQGLTFDLIVDPKLEVGNYEDLIRSVVRIEHNRDTFKDQSSVVKWLVDEGFLAPRATSIKENLRRLPKFLVDGSFMYMDEYGKLIVR